MSSKKKPQREAQFLNMDSELMQSLEDPETRRALTQQMRKQREAARQAKKKDPNSR